MLGCRHSGDPTLAKIAELSQKASEWLEKNQRYLELIQSLGELHKDQEEWMQNFPDEYAAAQSIMQGTPGAQPAASSRKPKHGTSLLDEGHGLTMIQWKALDAEAKQKCAGASSLSVEPLCFGGPRSRLRCDTDMQIVRHAESSRRCRLRWGPG